MPPGPGGYTTPTALGVSDASEWWTQSEAAHKWARCIYNPCLLGVRGASERETKSNVAQQWAEWLHNPCRLGVLPQPAYKDKKADLIYKHVFCDFV